MGLSSESVTYVFVGCYMSIVQAQGMIKYKSNINCNKHMICAWGFSRAGQSHCAVGVQERNAAPQIEKKIIQI